MENSSELLLKDVSIYVETVESSRNGRLYEKVVAISDDGVCVDLGFSELAQKIVYAKYKKGVSD